jgi:hypothetical protein
MKQNMVCIIISLMLTISVFPFVQYLRKIKLFGYRVFLIYAVRLINILIYCLNL